MKKTYEKPQIMFDSFELSQDIAAGCEFINGLQAQGVCGYATRDGVVFTELISGCKYTKPDGNNSLCYHVPAENTNIFGS